MYCTPEAAPAAPALPPSTSSCLFNLNYTTNWTVLVDDANDTTKAYVWMETKRSYSAAVTACAALGSSTVRAHLVTYSSYAEQLAVEHYFRNMGCLVLHLLDGPQQDGHHMVGAGAALLLLLCCCCRAATAMLVLQAHDS